MIVAVGWSGDRPHNRGFETGRAKHGFERSKVERYEFLCPEKRPARSKAATTVLTGPDISRAARSARSGRWRFGLWISDLHLCIIARPALYHEERTMSHTHTPQSTSRRHLAGSLRGSRPRKQARLRHWLLPTEHLEDRRLLAGSPLDTVPVWHRKDMITRGLRWGIAFSRTSPMK
jgi:hypothetical protein